MNRFFQFVQQFIADTFAKAEDVNARLGEVETGFDGVQGEMNVALRFPASENGTDWARLPIAATRASKLVAFDAAGNPIATLQFPADLDANGHRLTGLSTPVANTEPVTLGYFTSFAAAAVGIPSIVGNAGKFLSTDGIGVQWTQGGAPATVTTDDGAIIVSYAGTPQWGLIRNNLLLDPNGFRGGSWTTSLNAVIDEYGNIFRNNGVLTTATFDHASGFTPIGAAVPIIGTADVQTSGVSAGTISLLLKFYDSGQAALSESSLTAIANGQGWKRFSKQVTTPASTAYVKLIVRFAAASASASGVRVRNPKLEHGTFPTPFSNDTTLYQAYSYQAQNTFGAGLATVTVTAGDASTTQSEYDLRSAAGTQAYDVRMKSTGGTNGTPGQGTLTVESKAEQHTGAVGYDQEFDNGGGGTAITVNLQKRAYQRVQLNNASACAITLDNTKPPLAVGRLRLKLQQDATGGRPNPTWAGIAVTWLGPITPVVATGANAYTFVDFYWDGATLFGSFTAWS